MVRRGVSKLADPVHDDVAELRLQLSEAHAALARVARQEGLCSACKALLQSRLRPHRRALLLAEKEEEEEERKEEEEGYENEEYGEEEEYREGDGEEYEEEEEYAAPPASSARRVDSAPAAKASPQLQSRKYAAALQIHNQHEEDEEEAPSTRPRASVVVSRDVPSPLTAREREEARKAAVISRKDFVCWEKVGRQGMINVVEGLELHERVLSRPEQDKLVKLVESEVERGRAGELRGRTFSEPRKWMRGKGRVTIQYGCCYNYAQDSQGRPPGILPEEVVEPVPRLLQMVIERLVNWGILPQNRKPDTCIVNVYSDGDCIPPHIDHLHFLRPFCTLSLVSEADIVLGSRLEVIAPGQFGGAFALPLPVGSVCILKGNAADVAKHCIPAVPHRRISVTFRKMSAPFDELVASAARTRQPTIIQKHTTNNNNVSDTQRNPPLTSRPRSRNGYPPDTNGRYQQHSTRDAPDEAIMLNPRAVPWDSDIAARQNGPNSRRYSRAL